jgi:putative endonuclease
MRTTGQCYERYAADWLAERGLRIIARNFRCRAGEIDLVARDGSALVFVEVRARAPSRYASAAESVDRRKQQRLLRTAQFYLRHHPAAAHLSCRFDVIAIEPRQCPAPPQVRWIRSAFSHWA